MSDAATRRERRERQLVALRPVGPVEAVRGGQRLVLFSTNDYLGMSGHPRVTAAAVRALEQHGMGPRGSALICGWTAEHEALEADLAATKDTEAALLFPTGYQANLGALTTIAAERPTTFFSDAWNHASVIDGCRLARSRDGAQVEVWGHGDLAHLEEVLEALPGDRRACIVTDAVFGMDGEIADLAALADLADRYDALLVTDEAHATLVVDLPACAVDLRVGTLSKAVGALGGFVATSAEWRARLVNSARSLTYSTALPLPVAAAAREALAVAAEEPEHAERLADHRAVLGDALGREIATPIVPVVTGCDASALAAAAALEEQGLHVPAIRPPTVPEGTSRLRISLSAAHSRRQVKRLAAALATALSLILAPIGIGCRQPQHRGPVAGEAMAQAVLEQGFRDAEKFAPQIRLPAGMSVAPWAVSPQFKHPVAFTQDAAGRIYVVETYRHGTGTTDIREHPELEDEDLAARTVADRVAMLLRGEVDPVGKYAQFDERLRGLEDQDGDGRADTAWDFAAGFGDIPDGIAAGVLTHGDEVTFACVPHLWRLVDTDGDGRADVRRSLSEGYGVNMGFFGHDLHGLIRGPDGRLYFSIGDRGFHVQTDDGRVLSDPKRGAVLRCEMDGSGLEVVATGLRNPQELCFDDFGNLFTGDNNGDGADKARWVHVIEGGDSGWRYPFQLMTRPVARGPWVAEGWYKPPFAGQSAHLNPPVANIGSGPSGVAAYPGTGLSDHFDGRLFMVDFLGTADSSGIHSFRLEHEGAGFRLVDREDFIWNLLATDFGFGTDGAMYATDWVHGWDGVGQGRVWRFTDQAGADAAAATATVLQSGFQKRSARDLEGLLDHADRRVRLGAQWELADRGAGDVLRRAALSDGALLARLHGVWGLGQLARVSDRDHGRILLDLARDGAPEIRAAAVKCLSEVPGIECTALLVDLLKDPSAPVQLEVALAVGRVGRRWALEDVMGLLEQTGDTDPWLRHGAVMALTGLGRRERALLDRPAMSASSAVRMGALLAMRRLDDPRIAQFLADPDPLLVVEAARGIWDQPVEAAWPALADMAGSTEGRGRLAAGPDALWRRVRAAAQAMGRGQDAAALASWVGDDDLPASAQRIALEILLAWGNPPDRDPVVGNWRLLAERDPAAARAAAFSLIDRHEDHALSQLAPAVGRACMDLFVAYAPDWAAGVLPFLAAPTADLALRGHALELLVATDHPLVGERLREAMADPAVAAVAAGLLDAMDPAEALPLVDASLASRESAQVQGAWRALARMKGGAVDRRIAAGLASLSDGSAPGRARLEILRAAESRTSDEAVAALEGWRSSFTAADPLGARRVALEGGDPVRGEQLFMTDSRAECLKCHRVGEVGGSEAGPDLAGIGSRRTSEYLLQSILDPGEVIARGWARTTLWLDDETSVTGRILSEGDGVVVVEEDDGTETRVDPTVIEERRHAGSSMPGNFGELLGLEDVRDLVAWLAGSREEQAAPDDPDARPPNVVIVFTDDQGWGDTGFNGGTHVKTPHLDAMAVDGTVFTDFYDAQPVCSASRTALMTGCYPNRLGIHGALNPHATHGIDPDEQTLAEMLSERGYATAAFGKWHMGHRPPFLPTRSGFEEFSGIPYSNDMWPMHPEAPKGTYPPLPMIEGSRTVATNPDQGTFSTGFTDRAVTFIRRNADRPFFVYLAHPMPHVPLFVSPEGRGATGLGLYADVIAEIDAGVGRIRETLAELELTEDTLVIFTSDNGPWLSYGDHAGRTGGLREGKGTTWEGGIRVPCVMAWPGRIPADRVVTEPLMTIDVLPTLAELTGALLPERAIDGRSFAPLLLGEEGAVSPQDAYFFYYHRGDLEAMRSGRWKMHFPHKFRTLSGPAGSGGVPGRYDYGAYTPLALYDLVADRAETTDVAADHPDVVERLSAMADAMRADLGDRLTGVVGTGVRPPGTWSPETVSVPVPGGFGVLEFTPAAGFLMSTTEVPWEAYDVYALGLDEPDAQGAGVDTVARPSRTYIPPDREFGHEGFPAISMSGHGAQAFCAWLSEATGRTIRLPTVGEWRAAALRAGTGENQWTVAEGRTGTRSVGQGPESLDGLFDLLGNVAEWAVDEDGSVVACGPSWKDEGGPRSANLRRAYDPDWQVSDPQFPKSKWWLSDCDFVGFRLVLEP